MLQRNEPSLRVRNLVAMRIALDQLGILRLRRGAVIEVVGFDRGLRHQSISAVVARRIVLAQKLILAHGVLRELLVVQLLALLRQQLGDRPDAVRCVQVGRILVIDGAELVHHRVVLGALGLVRESSARGNSLIIGREHRLLLCSGLFRVLTRARQRNTCQKKQCQSQPFCGV